jgi:hypothetical protein
MAGNMSAKCSLAFCGSRTLTGAKDRVENVVVRNKELEEIPC